jgi:hypothetical protein
MTFASHVNNPHPTISSYDRGTTLVAMSHINTTSPTSIHHEGDDSLTSSSHIESMSLAIGNDAGGIEKSKFLCRTCEGDHLTGLFPTTVGIPEAWGSPKALQF